MSATNAITIGDAARRSGISPESIRHYERIGLLPSPVRGDNGYRYFSQETLDRLATIRAWRDIGMSLDEIRELSTATDGEEMRCGTVQRQLLAHAGEVRSRIQSLKALESRLRRLASECDPSRDECPVVRQMGRSSPSPIGERGPIAKICRNDYGS